MGLRVKLALAVLALLITAILAVTSLEINRVTRVMVDELGDSGKMLIAQTFEQLMPILKRARAHAAPLSIDDPQSLAFLNSAQAFGRGVMFVRVEDGDHKILAAVPPMPSGSVAPEVPDFSVLQQIMQNGSMLARVRTVWRNRIYVVSRAVEINHNRSQQFRSDSRPVSSRMKCAARLKKSP